MIDEQKTLAELRREIKRLEEAVENGKRLEAELMRKIERKQRTKEQVNGNSG